MSRLTLNLVQSRLYHFAQEAHDARFPAFAWKSVACDMMGIPVGSRPTNAQMMGIRCSWMTLWQELTQRFDQLTTVRWEEYLENEEERIHNALTYLGSTPDRVAHRLAQMGVMGEGAKPCDCPLAHFFQGVYGAWFVYIHADDSRVDFVPCGNPMQSGQFVKEFDEGKRSELDLFPDRVAIL